MRHEPAAAINIRETGHRHTCSIIAKYNPTQLHSPSTCSQYIDVLRNTLAIIIAETIDSSICRCHLPWAHLLPNFPREALLYSTITSLPTAINYASAITRLLKSSVDLFVCWGWPKFSVASLGIVHRRREGHLPYQRNPWNLRRIDPIR